VLLDVPVPPVAGVVVAVDRRARADVVAVRWSGLDASDVLARGRGSLILALEMAIVAAFVFVRRPREPATRALLLFAHQDPRFTTASRAAAGQPAVSRSRVTAPEPEPG
jgi:hypothetical protein